MKYSVSILIIILLNTALLFNINAQGFLMKPHIIDEKIGDSENLRSINNIFKTKIENSDYKSTEYRNKDDSAQKVELNKPDFIVSSSFIYNTNEKVYSIKVFFWNPDLPSNAIEYPNQIKTFEYSNHAQKIDASVFKWVDNVIDNINYYNSPQLGNGKFKRDIIVYLPDILSMESKNQIDEMNVNRIQQRIFLLLERNPVVQEKCCLDSVSKVKSVSTPVLNTDKADIYFYYERKDTGTKPVTLTLNVDFQFNCFSIDFNMGEHRKLNYKKIDLYIVDRWVENILIEKKCRNNF